MALDHAISGGIVLAASSVGMITAGSVGTVNVPISQLCFVSVFAALGAIGRTFLDAKDARDMAAKSGAGNLPRVDLTALAYALLGAPVVGNIGYAVVQSFQLRDAIAVPVIMGMGYLGRDGINMVVSIVKTILKARFGDK